MKKIKLPWRRLKGQLRTFDDLYPDAEEDFEPERGSHLVFKSEIERPCWRCGRLTKWIELSFEAHTCSPACDDEAWAAYALACAHGIEEL